MSRFGSRQTTTRPLNFRFRTSRRGVSVYLSLDRDACLKMSTSRSFSSMSLSFHAKGDSQIPWAEPISSFEYLCLTQYQPAIAGPEPPRKQIEAVRLREHLRMIPASRAARNENHLNQRCFSLDDVVQLKPQKEPTFTPSETTTSSTTVVVACTGPFDWTSFPHRPPYPPPPARRPTPPGLPGFGSREASNMRGVRSYQTPYLWYVDPDHGTTAGATRSDRFWNWLGDSGNARSAQSRRQTLPRGVIAIAPDGTPVRSRFGARHSGHGVGAGGGEVAWRGIEAHGFHQEPNQRKPNSSYQTAPLRLTETSLSARDAARSLPDTGGTVRSMSTRTSGMRYAPSSRTGSETIEESTNEMKRLPWCTRVWVRCCLDVSEDGFYNQRRKRQSPIRA